ncbi:BT4734/BF3469 family protein [Bacteroidota bacterium]
MELIKDILNLRISFQDNVWSGIIESSLGEALNRIKGNDYYNITNSLRELYKNNKIDEYQFLKRKLAAVTFCGLFEEKRTKSYLKEYNFIAILDIDKLGDEDLCVVTEKLQKDNYVFAFWESPSKAGIKGLVKLEYLFNIEKYGIDLSHKTAFKQLSNYFMSNHNIELDSSGSDVTRLCFLSHDKNLILKTETKPFQVKDIPKQEIVQQHKTKQFQLGTNAKLRNILYNPSGKNRQQDRKTIINIIKYLKKNNLSITYAYDEWMRVAFAIANSFTYEIGLKYFIDLSKMDSDKFNEDENTRLLYNCYKFSKGHINFNTITYFASKKGYKLN